MKRREFITKVAAGTLAAGTITAAPVVHAAKKFRWKMGV